MTLSPIEIIIAVSALLLGGFAKGISGMGVPIVATPILALLFDLKTAIAISSVSTLVCDIVMLIRLPKNRSVIKKAVVLMLFGIAGIAIGSKILIIVNQYILLALLGVVTFVFVATSIFKILPSWKQRRSTDAAVGLAAGILQGAAGACGPIISMYLLPMKMNRNEFLYMISSFFVVIDLTQFITIYNFGLYRTGHVSVYALLALIPTLLAMSVALILQKRISDQLFRKCVLGLISLSGIILLYKSMSFFF